MDANDFAMLEGFFEHVSGSAKMSASLLLPHNEDLADEEDEWKQIDKFDSYVHTVNCTQKFFFIFCRYGVPRLTVVLAF